MRQILLKFSLLSVYLITASLNAITANIPEMAKTFSSFPLYTIELIATVPSLFQMLGILAGGSVTKKFSLKHTVLFGLLCCAIGGSLPLFIQDFYVIFVTRCVFGLGCGFITTCMLSIIMALFEGNERSSMIGMTGSFGGLGSALSSFVAGRLLAFGWDKSFAVYLLGFVVFALVLFVVPNVQDTKSTIQQESASVCKPISLTILAFLSTLLATFYVIKISTLITTNQIGSAANGSLAITFFSAGSLLAGAMYGKIYAKINDMCLILFYFVCAVGFIFVWIPNLVVIYMSAMIVGWGMIAFTPYFQDAVARKYGHSYVIYILIVQALGAFAAPYLGTALDIFTSQITIQFLVCAIGYILLCLPALKFIKSRV